MLRFLMTAALAVLPCVAMSATCLPYFYKYENKGSRYEYLDGRAGGSFIARDDPATAEREPRWLDYSIGGYLVNARDDCGFGEYDELRITGFRDYATGESWVTAQVFRYVGPGTYDILATYQGGGAFFDLPEYRIDEYRGGWGFFFSPGKFVMRFDPLVNAVDGSALFPNGFKFAGCPGLGEYYPRYFPDLEQSILCAGDHWSFPDTNPGEGFWNFSRSVIIPIPLPATAPLAAGGVIGLALLRRLSWWG